MPVQVGRGAKSDVEHGGVGVENGERLLEEAAGAELPVVLAVEHELRCNLSVCSVYRIDPPDLAARRLPSDFPFAEWRLSSRGAAAVLDHDHFVHGNVLCEKKLSSVRCNRSCRPQLVTTTVTSSALRALGADGVAERRNSVSGRTKLAAGCDPMNALHLLRQLPRVLAEDPVMRQDPDRLVVATFGTA